MDFAFTSEQEMLRDAVRGALERAGGLGPAREFSGAGAMLALATEQGWTAIGIDEEQGGQGGGVIELAIVAEQLGYVAAPGPLLATTLAARLTAGTAVGAIAMRADDRFGDPRDLTVELGADGVLRGAVDHVLGGADVDRLIVPARSADGVRLVSVDVEAPGVGVARRPLQDVTRNLSSVGFDAVRGEALESGADEQALEVTGLLALALTAADTLGAAQRLLDMTVAHVLDRRQFGVPVGSFQAVKHAAADMLVDVETARSAVYFAAWAVDAGTDTAASDASMAKWLVGDAAARIGDRALALHGAIGFTWEHDLHLLLKRLRANAVLFGSSATHRERVAADLLAA